MIFQNILVSQLKIINCFKQPLYNLISTIKCEEDPLRDLRDIYTFFATSVQIDSKVGKSFFLLAHLDYNLELLPSLELKSASLVNGNNSAIIEKLELPPNSNSNPDLYLYIKSTNLEIQKKVCSNLKKDGDKVQIRVKLNEKVKEFVIIEAKISGDYFEFCNHTFSNQNECYLDFFPKEVKLTNYLLYYQHFCNAISYLSYGFCEAKIDKNGENIKSLEIETPAVTALFFKMKDLGNLGLFKFADFNVSLKQFKEPKSFKGSSEIEVSYKVLTLFFEVTKEIQKICFDVFVPCQNRDGKQKGSEKVSVEVVNDGIVAPKVEKYDELNLVEIQKEEKECLKVILGRPSGNIKNPIKAKDGLSIQIMDMGGDIIKFSQATLDVEEKTEGNFIFITFNLKKDEKNSNLYDAIINEGLISITLNGENGVIGTYGFYLKYSVIENCIFSDKLLSIPFPLGANPKSGFFTIKKIVIAVVVVVLPVCVGVFLYFYKKKNEEQIETV